MDNISTVQAHDGLFSSTTEYIALGCLVSYIDSEDDAVGAEPSSSSIQWFGQDVLRLQSAAWIKTQLLPSKYRASDCSILRVFVLPHDVARRDIDRRVQPLKLDLLNVIRRLDTAPHTWEGDHHADNHRSIDLWSQGTDQSLFYMFNMLESPAPALDHFKGTKQKYIREAMEDILDDKWTSGLRSTLYPYQRRSAALMLEREEHPTLQLDPRLEPRTALDGKIYYYNSRDLLFYKEPLYYESCGGGILAETMGLGKTLICLTLILATQSHLPKIPTEYIDQQKASSLRSLQQTAIAAIKRSSLPWQVELSRLEHHTGEHKDNLRKLLANNPPTYTIPVLPTRWNRNTILPPPKHLTLAATTLIVVPQNLCKQWQREIEKHVISGALSILVMDSLRKELPPAHELRQYDLVLFTRARFEMEVRDGADEQGRRLPPAHIPLVCRCPYIGATRERDCRCLQPDDVYDSPLKHLHFKRLIIDEGHSFSAFNTKAVSVANKLVVADHRWIVSGTPAKDMIGVELEMSTSQALRPDYESTDARNPALLARRSFNGRLDESDAVKSLGALASNFLKIRPWYSKDTGEPSANWDELIYRHEDLRKRTYTSYSNVLQRVLKAMVIKTRPEDVERDIILPPLVHRIIYLQPSFYDKATANLFSLFLIANAITSERRDQDYIFHKNNGKARTQLITNLRQSPFFWSGVSEDDLRTTIKTSRSYLEKSNTSCSEADRELLELAIASTEPLLNVATWCMLGQTHELGIYVADWPEDSSEFWSFDNHENLVITGVSQLLDAQRHVDEQIGSADLGAGLSGAGIRSLQSSRASNSTDKKADKTKGAVPTSSFGEDSVLKRRVFAIRHGNMSLSNKTSPKKGSVHSKSLDSSSFTAQKRRLSDLDEELAPNSNFARARIVGTTSTKLSYLIEQILEHYQDEKILVFYDGDHIAYYIAQTLELLHIKHEIYAKSLAATLKSEYVVRFDQGTEDRVLLMDVKQAAFGLNLSSASRIYFVNPVCRPDVEAQAIKRAHRIGQNRPVHVETLILQNTLEEQIHIRAQRMTRSEHVGAKVLEDDLGMQTILQNAQIIRYDDPEHDVNFQMARLKMPQQFWGRPGWRDTLRAAEQMQRKKSRTSVKKKTEEDATVKEENAENISPMTTAAPVNMV